MQARMALNNIDAALQSFKNALDLEPNDGLYTYCSLVGISKRKPHLQLRMLIFALLILRRN